MALGDALEDIRRALSGGPKDPKVAPRSVLSKNVFEYPKAEIAQGVLVVVTGLMGAVHGMLDGEGRSHPDLIVGSLAVAALGFWKARGIRRITIADGMLTGEFSGGRRETWPVAALYAEGRKVLVVVREKSSGRIAFVVRPGMPDQEALADLLGGRDGPGKSTPT